MGTTVVVLFCLALFSVPVMNTSVLKTEWLVAMIYSDAWFSCNVTGAGNVRWDFKATHGTMEALFARGSISEGYTPRFNVSIDDEVSDFYIGNITSADAGVYNCFCTDAAKKLLEMELTVLQLEPDCYISVQTATSTVQMDAQFHVGCRVCYTGEAPITVDCFSDRESDYAQKPTSSLTLSHPNGSCCVFNKTYTANRVVTESVFTCTVTLYSSIGRVEVYNYSWTSPTVFTLYGPTKPTIKRLFDGTVAHHGSRLLCTSSGRPEPEIRWTVSVQTVSSLGFEFLVDVCGLISAYEARNFSLMNVSTKSITVTCYAESSEKTEKTQDTFDVLLEEAYASCRTVPPIEPTQPQPRWQDHVLNLPTTTTDKPDVSRSMTYFVVGACALAGLVVIVITTVVRVVRRRNLRSQSTSRKPALNVFYNDASGSRSPNNVLPGAAYNEIPDDLVTSSRLYGPYDDLEELLSVTTGIATTERRSRVASGLYEEVVEEPDEALTTAVEVEPPPDNQITVAPYQGLDQHNRDLPAPPTHYNTLQTGVSSEATPQSTATEPAPPPGNGSESEVKPYEGLQDRAREPTPPPVVYSQLNTDAPPNTSNIVEPVKSKPYQDLQLELREQLPITNPPIYSMLCAKKNATTTLGYVELLADDVMQDDSPSVTIPTIPTTGTGLDGYLELMDYS